MRRVGTLAVGLLALLALVGCTSGGPSGPSSTPSAPVDSVAAFEAFAGVPVPSGAEKVTVRTTVTTDGQPSYRVRFTLPSSQLDAFCAAGQIDRPLRVTTIPDTVRKTFDYTGDSSTGVAISTTGLPNDQRIQREVFALGTRTATADVQVYAYQMPG